jgi:hypothetical protein
MGAFKDYAKRVVAGVGSGAGDMVRSGISDVGNTGQQILMADATIKPSQGLIGTMETTSYEVDNTKDPLVGLDPEPAPEPEPEVAPPEIDAEP